MPYGSFVNDVPPAAFMAVHIAAFLVGAYLAYRSFTGQASLLGWGFTLYALAEVSYMTYHLDWTVFLFAHTVSEVLDLAAFVLVFAGALQAAVLRGKAAARSGAPAP